MKNCVRLCLTGTLVALTRFNTSAQQFGSWCPDYAPLDPPQLKYCTYCIYWAGPSIVVEWGAGCIKWCWAWWSLYEVNGDGARFSEIVEHLLLWERWWWWWWWWWLGAHAAEICRPSSSLSSSSSTLSTSSSLSLVPVFRRLWPHAASSCPPLPSLRQLTDIVGKPHCGCHILHYYCVLDSSSSSKGWDKSAIRDKDKDKDPPMKAGHVTAGNGWRAATHSGKAVSTSSRKFVVRGRPWIWRFSFAC